MALELSAEKALIFRIVHRDNLSWILDHGLHACNGTVSDPNYRNIGNVELIGKRARRTVPVPPGGTLSDYVPFYFSPYSIMMFNVKTGYGGVQKVANQDLLIFVSSLPLIASQGISFVFTNQHAYPPMAEYFASLDQLDRVDWPLLQSRDFQQDPEDPAKKERYQAEALIYQHVPLEALLGVCCYTEVVARELKAKTTQRRLVLKCAAQPSWYF